MKTTEEHPGPLAARLQRSTAFDWGVRLAGPALIALGPLILLHGFWLGPKLTHQHVDLLPFWLPRWCFLGSSLRAGHIPTWLPNQFGGVPFASDPQSGWLYIPVMSLFSMFSCSRALGLVVVLNPFLGGLGIFLFSRQEGLGRIAATVGGVTFALMVAGSVVALTMPFSGALAWTALSLAAIAGLCHSNSRFHFIAWLGFAALSLSQVAAVHLTDGLLMATALIGVYLLFRLGLQVKKGEKHPLMALVTAVAIPVSVALLGAAVFIPRLALIPRTSIGHGYLKLAQLTAQLSGGRVSPPFVRRGASTWLITSFARGPGGYAGVAAILLLPFAFISRRWRIPSIAFALFGALGWALNANWLVGNKRVRSIALRHGLGQLWLRDPHRFRYFLIVAFALLAAYGVQAWLDRPSRRYGDITKRCLWFGVPVALFVALPIAAGAGPRAYVQLAAGAVVLLPFLVLGARGRSWAALALPVVVTIELTTSGLVGQTSAGRSLAHLNARGGFGPAFASVRQPDISPSAYFRAGAIGSALLAARGDFGRYLSFDPEVAQRSRGFLTRQNPATWAEYENGRSILFDIYEIQGYSPVQIDRYWRLVRAANPRQIFYNAAIFQVVRPDVLRLFGVEWLIVPAGVDPPSGATEVASEGRYNLYRVPDAEPRASMVYRWRVESPQVALSAVLEPGFDPAQEALLEQVPSSVSAQFTPTPSPRGEATYDQPVSEHVVVHVDTNSDGLLVVRNVNDRNWKATVDGRPTELLGADYLMQAVPVPAGRHIVELTYHDPGVGIGLAISAGSWFVWAALLAAPLAWRRIKHRSGRGVDGDATNTG